MNTVIEVQQMLRNVAEADPNDVIANAASQLVVELDLRGKKLNDCEKQLIRYAKQNASRFVLHPGARHAVDTQPPAPLLENMNAAPTTPQLPNTKSDKTFTHAGSSFYKNARKWRFGNGAERARVLADNGHTEVILVELPRPMTKLEAVNWLLDNGFNEQGLRLN